MRPYYALRSYTDNVKCLRCIDMERDGRDLRQTWPDYDMHVREVHVRHYDGQIGSEATPAEYVAALVECTREWVRVLKPSGSMFVNLGDKYGKEGIPGGNGSMPHAAGKDARRSYPRMSGEFRPKSLLGLPWRYALACTDQLGLILRAEIIWAKPNGLPESVTDRVRRAHEQVFHFTLRPRYYSAVDEIREPQAFPNHGQIGKPIHNSYERVPRGSGAERRGYQDQRQLNPLGKLPGSVWNIPSQPLTVPPALGTDHFAAFPMELPRRIITGWSPPGVCTACGEGRRPVVDKQSELLHMQSRRRGPLSLHNAERGTMGAFGSGVERPVTRDLATITGYACACGQLTRDAAGEVWPSDDRGLPPTRPAVVLDPFGGTGTTALLAHALGRTGITIDRSAGYCRLAAWRTTDRGELARALQVPKPPPVPEGQDALFDM